MFLKLLVEKRCVECKRLLKESIFKESIFDKNFLLDGMQSQKDLAICVCEKESKTFLATSAYMRVLQSIALLIISLVMTATLIVIRDSPILNPDSNTVLLGYELSINDVNRLQNHRNYESYLSKQFAREGFGLDWERLNSTSLHSNISAYSTTTSSSTATTTKPRYLDTTSSDYND